MHYVVKEIWGDEVWYLDSDAYDDSACGENLKDALRFNLDDAVFFCKHLHSKFPDRHHYIAPVVSK